MCLKRCHDNNLCLNVEYNKKQLRCKLLKDHDDGKETLLTQLRNVTKCQKRLQLSVCEENVERVHFSSGEYKCISKEQYRNVALGKPANLSSVWDIYSEAFYAVDGRGVVPGVGHWYCAHSDGIEPHPYLRIDLQNLFYIDHILLLTRGDYYAEYLHDVEVRVGHMTTWENMDTCGMFNKTAELGQTYKIKCTSCLVGKFVTVRILGDKMMHGDGGNQLSLCEVTVWGKRYYN
ncbi:uncharacterized protein LOC134268287 [Saccostrea cucullata]|uniref:uncharacterized protein LOC134268287 n=1 Tax=Saccostrea cuccullata TaxID=36930 RepID=UPI002ED67031